ncbi:SPOR domain-containing protein [Hydrogenophaga taeniospiralis]|uniref:SPOR domain-containing protein n=1 Tax=Hydrogenophaga taeniospiralis TaxID=65656 RepID=UPI001CFA88B9|nr:SPOR domain-containing protein [Hydrogenophaga taeniospiralis]UCU93607.1 SPOR domain-containing protein [Hydrogenophaga taeniospiralis]
MPSGTEALLRAALGPSAARVYLPILARFEERGRSGLVWSPRAALGNLAWLVYWRLWDAVLVQSILTVAGAGALGWLWARADGVPMGVRFGMAVAVAVLWCAVPGLWGVAWLHGGLRQRTVAAVEDADTFKEALEHLERSVFVWRPRGYVLSALAALSVVLLVWGAGQLLRGTAESDEPASAALLRSTPPPSISPVVTPTPAPAPAHERTDASPVVDKLVSVIESPAAEPAAERVLPAPDLSGVRPRVRGFGVNVGLFSVVANAERAKARLSEAGLPVLDDPVESARGPLTRVRVGPFDRREDAEAAAQKVRALGLEARVYAP